MKTRYKGETKSNKTESETITLRIEKSLLDELRQESEHNQNSINILINQILKKYLQWYKPSKKAGIGLFPKVFVREMMDKLTEYQVIKTTEEFCKNNLFELSNMLGIKTTLSSFMDGYCSWLEESGINYRVDRFDDTDTYVIQFDMGRNWSLYTIKAMQFVFDHYNAKDTQCEMTDNTVIIKIKRS